MYLKYRYINSYISNDKKIENRCIKCTIDNIIKSKKITLCTSNKTFLRLRRYLQTTPYYCNWGNASLFKEMSGSESILTTF